MRNSRWFSVLGIAAAVLHGGAFAGEAPKGAPAAQTAKARIDRSTAETLAKEQKPFALTPAEEEAANARWAAYLKKRYRTGLREKVPPSDWIASAYHGEIYDANYDRIVIDERTAALIQDSLFERLLSVAKPGAFRSIHDGDLKALYYAGAKDPFAALIVRGTILEAMLEAAPQTFIAEYAWRHHLVQREVRQLRDGLFWQINPEILRILKDARFRFRPDGWLIPAEPTTAYIEGCKAADVPIPPDFPDASWKRQGEQLTEFILASLRTEVYAYFDPKGVCYALPRTSGDVYSRGGLLVYDGIICQSKTTGKACFWDNMDRATGARITGNSVALDIQSLMDGSNLDENCTMCHRGGNVFNIHPGTAVDLTRPSTIPGDGRPNYDAAPAVRYAPIGGAGTATRPYWNNPGPLYAAGSGGCASCHEIPDPTALPTDFCSILRQAAIATMPPPGSASAAGWPAPAASIYRAHTNALRTRCGS